jgi:glucokinase
MILAGDIGGTQATLALFAVRPGVAPGLRPEAMLVESFLSRDYPQFGELLQGFCARHRPRVEAACIGIAGPVLANRCAATNLPWTVDGAEIAALLGLGEVALLNDLEALGFAIDLLRPQEICELQAGAPGAQGNRAVIAAGTGLGEAGLYWDGATHRPFATEGGHADFAPQDELQIALLRYLRKMHEHVSWERVVSGPGLVHLYRFLLASQGARAVQEHQERQERLERLEPPGMVERMQSDEPAAVVWHCAASGESPLCGLAVDLFLRLYGAEAGNLALKTMATGGLYIGGGIAPKILDWMRRGPFIEAFRAKGRMRPLLEAMPVRVILDPQAALLGAARYAALRRTARGTF